MKTPVCSGMTVRRMRVPDKGSVVRIQANTLGFAGLIPFLALAALPLVFRDAIALQAGRALIVYGAVIISFLGACHWSAAVIHDNNPDVAGRMLFAVSPALLGWLAVLVALPLGFALIITGLLLTLVADSHWPYGPAWYATLRRRLTSIAILCLSFAILTTLEVI